MSDLRLVIFDVDGTLSDSQAEIVGAMEAGFAAVGLPAPSRAAIKSIVGLSLETAIPQLAPQAAAGDHAAIVAAYKAAYREHRLAAGSAHSPLFPGMADLVADLAAEPETLVAIATGKSRRGLDALLETHGIARHFITTQVADDHPSKPHPSMILTTLAETGVEASRAVMIGDTTFDIDMACNAGVAAIGVDWGFHPVEALHRARAVVSDAAALRAAIDRLTPLRVA
ncbi:HAD-IA family hydrolase [Pseudooceanicola sp. CBS1P-1]|uniref:HAD-IA family hydrolase n=1 Tax=Pseudooceanicola albus TaxID=2692189 RepID=A0A6L7FZS0_9RHOB|nr:MULTISPECIES: HAD-IA family hydrolase [Pseudooceanicola]MBT9382757.1 HAD-IA family hydrolase [Pseudooceanicola endophyticus]MXN17295.1 HAD-IA family hydrolase [Pseudooceanicola albus]